jgi:hypothetical protein
MGNNELPDTSQILSDDDLQVIASIRKIKRTLMASFQPGFLVETIKKLVEDSDVINFASARAAKFLNNESSTFSLSLDKEKAELKYGRDSAIRFYSDEDVTKWISNCIYDEIINPFSTIMTEKLKNEEILKEEVESVFKVSREELKENLDSLERFLISSIFGIKIDLTNYGVLLALLK